MEWMILSISDVEQIVEVLIYFLQVPNVKWEDVGGLEDVKKSILDTVQVGLSVSLMPFSNNRLCWSGIYIFFPFLNNLNPYHFFSWAQKRDLRCLLIRNLSNKGYSRNFINLALGDNVLLCWPSV